LDKFLNNFSRSDIRKLIEKSGWPIALEKESKREQMILKVLEIIGAKTVKDSELEVNVNMDSIVKRLEKLKMEKRYNLAKGVTSFARGDIKEGLDKLENSEKKQFTDVLNPKNYAEHSVQGFFFEVSVYHALSRLISKDLATHGIKKVQPYCDFTNFQNKTENSDGYITINVRTSGPELERIDCLYDCKSRKENFSMHDDLLKFMDYLYEEVGKNNDRGRTKNWRSFIVFSSNFSVNINHLIDDISRNHNFNNYTLILWEAKALRRLMQENQDKVGELSKYIEWRKIFDFSKKAYLIDEAFVIPIIQKALKEYEAEN
jgi:hypothetical protein